MEIIRASVVRFKQGPDHVSLETDLKEPIYPYAGPLSLNFTAARGTGQEYVLKNFPGVRVDTIFTD